MKPIALNLHGDEFALSRNLMVDLWMECRAQSGEVPLREVRGGDFIICNDALYDSFIDFTKAVVCQGVCVVKGIELLTYWLQSCKISSMKHVTLMGKEFLLMSSSDLDSLCQWVYDTRKLWGEKGVSCYLSTSKRAVKHGNTG